MGTRDEVRREKTREFVARLCVSMYLNLYISLNILAIANIMNATHTI